MKAMIILALGGILMSCQGSNNSDTPASTDAKVNQIQSKKWTNRGLNRETNERKEVGYFVFEANSAKQVTTCTDKSFGEESTVTVVAETSLEWAPDSVMKFGPKAVERKKAGNLDCVSSVGGYKARYTSDEPFAELRLVSLDNLFPAIVLQRVPTR